MLAAAVENILPPKMYDDNNFNKNISDCIQEKDTQISYYNTAKVLKISYITVNNFVYLCSTYIKKKRILK